jgi:hypothetical protein
MTPEPQNPWQGYRLQLGYINLNTDLDSYPPIPSSKTRTGWHTLRIHYVHVTIDQPNTRIWVCLHSVKAVSDAVELGKGILDEDLLDNPPDGRGVGDMVVHALRHS